MDYQNTENEDLRFVTLGNDITLSDELVEAGMDISGEELIFIFELMSTLDVDNDYMFHMSCVPASDFLNRGVFKNLSAENMDKKMGLLCDSLRDRVWVLRHLENGEMVEEEHPWFEHIEYCKDNQVIIFKFHKELTEHLLPLAKRMHKINDFMTQTQRAGTNG